MTQRARHYFAMSVLISTTVLWSACGQNNRSSTDDIFLEDRGDAQTGNDRRRPADNQLKLWTIDMNGCTGHLIAPEYMMTAAHCSPSAGARYRSGYALARNLGRDITVKQVVESQKDLDYAILSITWANGYPKEQKFPTLIATKASDINAASDQVFTVGFPTDKSNSWGATYSEGKAREASGKRLYYDMGIINGNSGGGVWRKSDNMLVSLTNGGRSAFGQSGWNTANINDSNAWNSGPTMWAVYERSATLKDIFPSGKNRFSTTNSDEQIFVMIGKEDPSSANSFELWFSVSKDVDSLVMCWGGDIKDCANPVNSLTADFAQEKDGRKIYKSRTSISLQSNEPVSVLAKKASAKVGESMVKFSLR